MAVGSLPTGQVHDEAVESALTQCERYRQAWLQEQTPVERDFEEATRKLKALQRGKKSREAEARR